MTTIELLSAVSMDLKRSALGRFSKSHLMSEKFAQEAMNKLELISLSEVSSYIKTLIPNIISTLKQKNDVIFAENTLMYSTLIQNYCVTRLKDN